MRPQGIDPVETGRFKSGLKHMDQSMKATAKSKPARSGLVRAIELVLLVAIVFLLTRAVITFFAPSSVWSQPEISAQPQASAQAARGGAIAFSGFDPFHRAADSSEAPVQDNTLGADAPETKLRLALKGRRAGPNGSAVLQLPDNSQANFHVGDEIIDGVELRAVTPVYIVIEQSGRLERLTFDKERVMSEVSAAPDKPAVQASAPQTAQRSIAAPVSAGAVDFNTLLRENTLSTVRRGGQSIGIRVTPKSSRDSLSALGLKPGDIIQKIGAVDVSSGMPNPNALIRSLQGQDSVSVTVLRGEETITVDISQ